MLEEMASKSRRVSWRRWAVGLALVTCAACARPLPHAPAPLQSRLPMTIRLFGYSPSSARQLREAVQGARSLITARLEAAQPSGIEWLACRWDAPAYQFAPSDPSLDYLSLPDAGSATKQLPLTGTNLLGFFAEQHRVRIRYVVIGSYELTGKSAALLNTRRCPGATHYLRSMQVGAYVLSRYGLRPGQDVEQDIAQSEVPAQQELMHSNWGLGGLDVCRPASGQSAAEASCQTPLQVELVPLPGLWSENVKSPPR